MLVAGLVTGVEAGVVDRQLDRRHVPQVERDVVALEPTFDGHRAPEAGVASPLGRMVAEAAGAGIDRAGRVQVKADCTLPGHPEVFVIGDLMSLRHLPGVAQVAIQSGSHAANTIVRRQRGGHQAPVPLPRQGDDGDDLALCYRRASIS